MRVDHQIGIKPHVQGHSKFRKEGFHTRGCGRGEVRPGSHWAGWWAPQSGPSFSQNHSFFSLAVLFQLSCAMCVCIPMCICVCMPCECVHEEGRCDVRCLIQSLPSSSSFWDSVLNWAPGLTKLAGLAGQLVLGILLPLPPQYWEDGHRTLHVAVQAGAQDYLESHGCKARTWQNEPCL